MKRFQVGTALCALALAGVSFRLLSMAMDSEHSEREMGRASSLQADGEPTLQTPPPDVLKGELAFLRERAARSSNASELMLRHLLELAESDPEAAVRLSAMLTEAEGREHALHECVPHWLNDDPEGARAWLLGDALFLPPNLIGALARDTASFDPRTALLVADTLLAGERASPMADVFSAWAAKDPVEAARVAEELGQSRDRAVAFEAVGKLWAESDGQSALEWAARQKSGSRRSALESVIGAWAVREPEAAARSLAALPATEPFRQRLLDAIAAEFYQSKPNEALTWASTLEQPEEREATTTTILLRLVTLQPSGAADHAFEVSDGKMTPLVDKVVAAWSAADKAAAERWTRSHGLAVASP